MKTFETQLEKSNAAHDKVPINEVIFPCVWAYDDDDGGLYSTECGEMFQFTNDGVRENGFKFCPFCGFRIKTAEP